MAKSRKDNKGRVLRKGETQRSCDGKYVYTYTDPEGKRRSIYSKDIMELREREAIYYPMPTSGFLCLCYFSRGPYFLMDW